MDQNREKAKNLSFRFFFFLKKVSLVCISFLWSQSLFSIVPNLTFWFNDLILEGSRNLYKSYSRPWERRSLDLGEPSTVCKQVFFFSPEGSRWKRVGFGGSGGNDFFRVCKSTNCARPAPPGANRRHLGLNKQRRLTFCRANNGRAGESNMREIHSERV